MAKLLITGCAGFIGSHLTDRLLSEGHAVTGLDNFDPFYPRKIKEQNMLAFSGHPSFRLIEADIASPETFEGLGSDFDAVIHLAAKAGVRPSIKDPDDYLRVNIKGTQNVANWMAASGLDKLIFAGSSSVYGNNKNIPFSESDNVDFPISPYAYTKKAGELLLHTYHHLYRISTLCLRFFTVYGPRQRPDLAIHKFTRMIFDGKPITMYGDGSTSRDYTYISDTVDGISRALDFILESGPDLFEIINLGNNTPVTLQDLINAIFEATGRTVPVQQLDMQPGDVDVTYADISKAQALLGYSPSTSLNRGLAEFVAWYKETHG